MAERRELCFIADNSERVYRITLVNFRSVMFNIVPKRGLEGESRSENILFGQNYLGDIKKF